MPKIFIQNRSPNEVAMEYVGSHNSAVRGRESGEDTRAWNATRVAGTIQHRMASLATAYEDATTPAAKQAALDAIAYYAFRENVVRAQGRGDYEIEQPANYAQFAQQALSTARAYAAQEVRAEREAETAREAAAERTRRANRTPQERALDEHFPSPRGQSVNPQSSRGQVLAVLNRYYNSLPANITGEERYNRARNAIDNELERVDTSFWTSSDRERALGTARRVLDQQQEIEQQAATRRAERPQPAATAQPVAAAPAGAVMHGTRNTHYGQSVSIVPSEARNTARIAMLSATFGNGQHFNNARVNEILEQIPVAEQYTNAQLRNLHRQRAAVTTQDEKNAITAAIGVLTLENKFTEERAAGRTSFRMFANNQEVVNYYSTALRRAGTYAVDDQTVAPAAPSGGEGAPAGGEGAPATGGRNGGATASGLRVYGRRDGTPAPNPEEVPNLRDEAQVRALQERLGVTVDGMYGPETHRAMQAAAQAQNKQPQDFDFTAEGIFEAFIAALTGEPAGEGQTAGGQSQPATEAPIATTATPGAAAAAAAMARILHNDVGADSESPNEQADDYSAYISTPAQAAAALQRLGLTMTPEQVGRLTVQNGRIHSPDILRLEQALNAVRGDARAFEENGNFDSRLRRIMQAEGVSTFVGAIFSGTASPADSQAPGGAGAGGGQVTQRG